MTQRQTCSGNDEYVLGALNDETPSNSSEESVNSRKLVVIPKEPSPESDPESLYKFEKNAINKIMAIKSEVEKFKEEILSAEKEVLERDFKKYEEALILKTLSLDNIETKGIGKIKETRKETVLLVQDCLKLLDSKINNKSCL